MSKDHRLGKFRVSSRIIWDDPKTALAILRDVIIVDVQQYDFSRTFLYTAIHPEFDRLVDGEAVPEYVRLLEQNSDGSVTAHDWKKVT